MSSPAADSTAIQQYDHAWNAAGVDERRALLEAALTEDCELVEPRGRYVGREAIIERIAGFAERFPVRRSRSPPASTNTTTSLDTRGGSLTGTELRS